MDQYAVLAKRKVQVLELEGENGTGTSLGNTFRMATIKFQLMFISIQKVKFVDYGKKWMFWQLTTCSLLAVLGYSYLPNS